MDGNAVFIGGDALRAGCGGVTGQYRQYRQLGLGVTTTTHYINVRIVNEHPHREDRPTKRASPGQ